MSETTLANAVDNLAKRKAAAFISGIHDLLTRALKDHWRPAVAGGSAWAGEDVKAVLLAFAETIGKGREAYKVPAPTSELIDHCRATIINDLLSGLPKLKELALMQAEEDISESQN